MYSKWKQLANKRITNVCLKRLSGYVNNKHESLKTKSIVIWNNFCTKPKKIHFLENFLSTVQNYYIWEYKNNTIVLGYQVWTMVSLRGFGVSLLGSSCNADIKRVEKTWWKPIEEATKPSVGEELNYKKEKKKLCFSSRHKKRAFGWMYGWWLR